VEILHIHNRRAGACKPGGKQEEGQAYMNQWASQREGIRRDTQRRGRALFHLQVTACTPQTFFCLISF